MRKFGSFRVTHIYANIPLKGMRRRLNIDNVKIYGVCKICKKMFYTNDKEMVFFVYMIQFHISLKSLFCKILCFLEKPNHNKPFFDKVIPKTSL